MPRNARAVTPHLEVEKDRSGVLGLGYLERAGGVETGGELHGRTEHSREKIELCGSAPHADVPFEDAGLIEEMEDDFGARGRDVENIPGIGETRME